MKNTAEVLRIAATRVRQGWTRHTRDDGRGRVCALGALNVGLGDHAYSFRIDGRPELSAFVADALQLPMCWSKPAAIANWNNAADQTAENVATGLEYAALLWEQTHAQPESADAVARPVEVSNG
jgi:hypothetical protein